jgi:cell division transport system permease protein
VANKQALHGGGVPGWLNSHREAAANATIALRQRPISSLLTVLVLAVSLSLPAGLYVVVANINTATDGLGSSGQLSVFLDLDADEQDAARVANNLERSPALLNVESVSPDAGLAQFSGSAGLDDVVAALEENPLPWLVQAQLAQPDLSLAEVDALLADIRGEGRVDEVIFDREWLLRLQAFIRLIEAAVDTLALFLGLTVVLLVGNTLRVEIESRRQEIEVNKLIGGSDAFVGRPFLYLGAWLGGMAGLAAVVLVQLCVMILSVPVARLAESYAAQFVLNGLSLSSGSALFGIGILLGFFGALVTVRRETARIEPPRN